MSPRGVIILIVKQDRKIQLERCWNSKDQLRTFKLGELGTRWLPRWSRSPVRFVCQVRQHVRGPGQRSKRGHPWTAACQASLSITNSRSLLKLMSIKSTKWCHPTISSSVIPFSSCLQLFQHQSLFQWISSSNQGAKVLELQLQHQSFQ